MGRNGNFIWDEINNSLLFVSREPRDRLLIHETASPMTIASYNSQKHRPSATVQSSDAQLFQQQNELSQAKYRKEFQRRVKVNESDVVTMQDVKDVAIFFTNPATLTPQFVKYFHTAAMDRFLRALIVYFQYYVNIWDKMVKRRSEAGRKVRHPRTVLIEDAIRGHLAELRCILAKYYAALLLGMEDAAKYHHMHNKNNTSLSEKERRMFECLIPMLIRVVWIALQRKHFSLIKIELNRLFRTAIFNPEDHKSEVGRTFNPTTSENDVLIGETFRNERKLKHRSPAVQEMIFQTNTDYRMIAIGLIDVQSENKWLNYLEIAYTAPEEMLIELGVTVGILGWPRQHFDAMLKADKDSSRFVHRSSFSITSKVPLFTTFGDRIDEGTLNDVRKPCRFKETQATILAREKQCKVWLKYLQSVAFGLVGAGFQETASMYQSYMSAKTSVFTWREN